MSKYSKIIVVLLISTIAGGLSPDPISILYSMIEITAVWIFSASLYKKNRVIGYLVNSVLLFVIMMQQAVLYFSGEYVTTIMLMNIESFKALGAKLPIYLFAVFVVIVISLLPMKFSQLPSILSKKISVALSVIYFIVAVTLSFTVYSLTSSFSPIGSFAGTIESIIIEKYNTNLYSRLENTKARKAFKRDFIADGVTRPEELPEQPNVIVIFTEGLSKELIDTDKVENLMPNLAALEQESLSFENYFNHTAATYRGLRGQLYSSYQHPDGVGNTITAEKGGIISIVDVLKAQGYYSEFINSEPTNKDFTKYLNSLKYNKVVSKKVDRNVTDKEMFKLLEKKAETIEQPFFLSMYNIGTHHGFESPDVKYGDGKSDVLNKFHNYDAQFGKFFEEFKKSDLAKNTILILTADHATFPSPEFKQAISSDQTDFIAPIPLMIYYDGVVPQKIDAQSRNSLDLTPTILDLLDVQQVNNYFLGNSLFQNEEVDAFERVSAIGDNFYSTAPNRSTLINPDDENFKGTIASIKDYYSFAMHSN
ncbi:MAG: LTA synthase family protein [Lactobacillales bacterium]|jgi:phosphoglycerol transferase MdoB-like AlkP superfamily enzyme|nr:LTA synthase family protein [Lactobacillales bacterium]